MGERGWGGGTGWCRPGPEMVCNQPGRAEAVDFGSHDACFRSSYNFCWPVRTLAFRDEEGRLRGRSPAMAAGLADHVWSMSEWLSFPAVQHC